MLLRKHGGERDEWGEGYGTGAAPHLRNMQESVKEYMLWETCHSGDLNVLLEKTNLLLQKGDEHARKN